MATNRKLPGNVGYLIRLTPEDQESLQQRLDDAGTSPAVRERLEIIRLSNAGLSAPKIADKMGLPLYRVRLWVIRFLDGGFNALRETPETSLKPKGPKGRFTDDQIRSIREAFAAGRSLRDLGEEYAVSYQTIGNVVTGRINRDAGGPITERSRTGWNSPMLRGQTDTSDANPEPAPEELDVTR